MWKLEAAAKAGVWCGVVVLMAMRGRSGPSLDRSGEVVDAAG